MQKRMIMKDFAWLLSLIINSSRIHTSKNSVIRSRTKRKTDVAELLIFSDVQKSSYQNMNVMTRTKQNQNYPGFPNLHGGPPNHMITKGTITVANHLVATMAVHATAINTMTTEVPMTINLMVATMAAHMEFLKLEAKDLIHPTTALHFLLK